MNGTVKLWRWRRNPLRRRSDVAEAWVGLGVGVVMAVGAPVSGVAAADGMHTALTHQNQSRHHVPAVVTHDAPTADQARAGGANPDQIRTTVRWADRDGAVHMARVAVAPGARAGTSVPVWLDGRDRLTGPPLSPGETTVQSDVMGAGAAAGFCVVALATHRLAQAGLDRHRSRRWEREWSRVEPRWSRGRHA